MKKELTNKEYIRYLYDISIGRVVDKIKAYAESPETILHDLKSAFFKIRYHLLNLLDPPPLQKRKELTDKYFERINPKYGLRFYQTLVAMGYDFDLGYALPKVDEVYKDKKMRKAMKEVIITFKGLHQKNIEKLNRFKVKNELANSQDN